eukprot:scaffold22595_cov63-Phaeocystis_antarctica.AAC.7
MSISETTCSSHRSLTVASTPKLTSLIFMANASSSMGGLASVSSLPGRSAVEDPRPAARSLASRKAVHKARNMFPLF